jgi:DHA2 family multidrug resistance protein
MAMMGRLGQRFDARILITIGVLLFLSSMWMHYHFTTDIGMRDLFWPMVLRGTGLGFIFVPLTGAAVADFRPSQLAQGTGLFNLSRQLGGSFGIALTATLLTRFTEQSREALLPHLAAGSPVAVSWLEQATRRLLALGGGPAEAQQRAHALLEATLRQQASMVAFEKVFLTMGLTFAAALHRRPS